MSAAQDAGGQVGATSEATAAPPRATDEDLDDLRRRLAATRTAPLPGGLGWQRGTDPDFLARLVEYWASEYDWRVHETRLRSQPWVRTGEGRTALRLIHQPSSSPDAPTVVLLHGWPDSVLRFERVLPLLSDVNVVVPALPGFPFAAEVDMLGMSIVAMAEVVAASLQELGYDHYVLSGGDVGGDVAEQLAAAHPDRVSALHLTNVSPRHFRGMDIDSLPENERGPVVAAVQWRMVEGGYIAEQSTKPHSLAPGLTDSPAGLAAWIVEKLRSWSGSNGDVTDVFGWDDLLTWISAYWTTRCIGTSFSAYVEPAQPVERVSVPTAMSVFPDDITPTLRETAERFLEIRSWTQYPSGGHFAAWEAPEDYVRGVHAALQLVE